MKPKVLISGGLGYLGGRMARLLFEEGSFSVRLGSKRMVQADLPDWIKKQELAVLDMLSQEQMREACQGISVIIHLAALNEIECAKDPDAAIAVNTCGTKRLHEIARESGVKRFIYMSSAHVYGAPLTGELSERTIPNPRHPYAISKLAGEYFVRADDRLENIVVRNSNGFGCPVHQEINRWGLVVNNFCRSAVTDRKIVLRSNGLDYRDFVSFRDVTAALLHLMKLPADRIGDGLFNFGTGQSIRVIDMAKLVAGRCKVLFGFEPEIAVHGEAGQHVDQSLSYDISKILSTGLQVSGQLGPEIDDLLVFCHDHF